MLKVVGRKFNDLKPEGFVILAALIGGGYAMFRKKSSPPGRNSYENDESKYIFLPSDKRKTKIGEFPSKALQLTKSTRKRMRHKAVKLLARKNDLDESQMKMLAQMIDLKTAVGLARISEAELHLFLPPPPSSLLMQESLEHQFRKIFHLLPFEDSNQCAKYLIEQAREHLKESYELHNEQGSDNVGESYSIMHYYRRHRQLLDSHIKKYLEAILEYSAVHSHQQLMVKNGLLKLLQDVFVRFESDSDICSLIGKIISNLALSDNLHSQLFIAGWIGILAKWMRSSSLQICLPAAKALYNMDRDYEDAYLEDGVYIFYPHYRERKKISADIVFIHGIKGSAFKTWRQHDNCKIDERNKKGIKGISTHVVNAGDSGTNRSSNYSFCWPKDWLSREMPFARLIALDYESGFVEWDSKCPLDKEKRTMKIRAKETLKKLISAGIGERPVIWITHSMGGIIAKQILVEASKSQDEKQMSIVNNTTGMVFFSVPHFGSDAATLTKGTAMVLKPTIEAQVMKKDSPELLELHEEFVRYILKHDVKILSFGETVKSKISKFHREAILVPKNSADPGFGAFYEVPSDHLSICKPESAVSSNYTLLVSFIKDVLSESSSSLQKYEFWKDQECLMCLIQA